MKYSELIFCASVVVSICVCCLGQDSGIPEGIDPDVFVKWMDKRITDFCPSGIDRCECVHEPGKFTKGPFSVKEDWIGSVITFVECNPGYCFCKDAPNVEVDIRFQMLREVMDLCPRGEMDRCLCKDNTIITWPFTLTNIQFCNPRKCKCKNSNEPNTLTALGCAGGGRQQCARDVGRCKDGTGIDITYSMKYELQHGITGCLCPDGIMPKCVETGEFAKCPNGEDFDFSIGGDEHVVNCRKEDWKL